MTRKHFPRRAIRTRIRKNGTRTANNSKTSLDNSKRQRSNLAYRRKPKAEVISSVMQVSDLVIRNNAYIHEGESSRSSDTKTHPLLTYTGVHPMKLCTHARNKEWACLENSCADIVNDTVGLDGTGYFTTRASGKANRLLIKFVKLMNCRTTRQKMKERLGCLKMYMNIAQRRQKWATVLYFKRMRNIQAIENLEEMTYESWCEYDELDGRTVDIIPERTEPPRVEQISNIDENIEQVFFDIETSSLSLDCDILQISAKCKSSLFNVYMLPKKRIDQGASEVTGLTVSNGQLCYKGIPVLAHSHEVAVNKLLDWLYGIRGHVICYGHNCRIFDCPRLLLLLKNHDKYNLFSKKVIGFVDSLPLFRCVLPDQKSYAQENLVSALLGDTCTYAAHNALEDVRGLHDLTDHVSPSTSDHLKYSFTTEYALLSMEYSLNASLCLQTLKPLINRGAISKSMARKAAQSGLALKHLKAAFDMDPMEGIDRVFAEKDTKRKVRVSACKRVIEGVQRYFEN